MGREAALSSLLSSGQHGTQGGFLHDASLCTCALCILTHLCVSPPQQHLCCLAQAPFGLAQSVPPANPSIAVATCELRSTREAGLNVDGVFWFGLTDTLKGNASNLLGHVDIQGALPVAAALAKQLPCTSA